MVARKRSVELDLKRKVEQQRLHQLAATADVVVSSFRSHAAVALAADYDVLASLNSGLVYVQISGFGLQGPYVGYPGYEDVVAAKTGRMHAFAGTAGREGRSMPPFRSPRTRPRRQRSAAPVPG